MQPEIRPRVSVCMAAFNGSAFIEEQLRSVLSQLEDADEIIIVDDCSTDDTASIIRRVGGYRVQLLQNELNIGVLASFEKALRISTGEIVFLCDQDDRWHDQKVRRFLREFRDDAVTLVISTCNIIDRRGQMIRSPEKRRDSAAPGIAPTIVRNRYQGSLMAFRRSILPAVLPFPSGVPMHDWWIGAVNSIVAKGVFLAEPLVDYRRHGANASPASHTAIPTMLRYRLKLVRALWSRRRTIVGLRTILRGRAQ